MAKNQIKIDTSNVAVLLNSLKRGLTDGGVTGFNAGWLKSTEYKSEDETDKKPPKIYQVALWNEMGVKINGIQRIPARPFIRYARKHMNDIMHTKMKEYMSANMPLKKMAKVLSLDLGEILRSEIEYGSFKANAKSTVRRKGSSQPLIDTRQMINSIHVGVATAQGDTDVQQLRKG